MYQKLSKSLQSSVTCRVRAFDHDEKKVQHLLAHHRSGRRFSQLAGGYRGLCKQLLNFLLSHDIQRRKMQAKMGEKKGKVFVCLDRDRDTRIVFTRNFHTSCLWNMVTCFIRFHTWIVRNKSKKTVVLNKIKVSSISKKFHSDHYPFCKNSNDKEYSVLPRLQRSLRLERLHEQYDRLLQFL